MFGFDNKTQDLGQSTAPAMPNPAGAPALPQDSQMSGDQSQMAPPMDPGADEGTMNDDMVAAQQNPMNMDQAAPMTESAAPPSTFGGEHSAAPATDMQQPQAPTPPPATVTNTSNDDLMSLKQEALQQLSPIVGHLDQTPEEKFKTTMMMIQASDDQTLIPVAYQAANSITDEKVKAQALLDIVNEINYFTQHHNQG